jgi:hypothetical protein
MASLLSRKTDTLKAALFSCQSFVGFSTVTLFTFIPFDYIYKKPKGFYLKSIKRPMTDDQTLKSAEIALL